MEKCEQHQNQTKDIKIEDNLDAVEPNIIKISQKTELGTGGRIWESVKNQFLISKKKKYL